MEAQRWCCLWGLLFITFVNAVFQEPLSFTWVKVNSSVKIRCSKSVDQLSGVSLRRGIESHTELMYVDMKDGKIKRKTTKSSLTGRIEIMQNEQNNEYYGFTWLLSRVRVEDTDWYYCSWQPKPAQEMMDELRGTTVIVTEIGPPEKCQDRTWTFTLSFIFILAILFLIVALGIVRCKQVKQGYVITRVVGQSQRLQHQRVCQQHQQTPYMVISENNLHHRPICI